MNNKQNKSVEEILEEFDRAFRDVHQGESFDWILDDFENWLRTILTHHTTQIRKEAVEGERERVFAIATGVKQAFEVSLHNAVSDQKAPYRHIIAVLDTEILQTLTSPIT